MIMLELEALFKNLLKIGLLIKYSLFLFNCKHKTSVHYVHAMSPRTTFTPGVVVRLPPTDIKNIEINQITEKIWRVMRQTFWCQWERKNVHLPPVVDVVELFSRSLSETKRENYEFRIDLFCSLE